MEVKTHRAILPDEEKEKYSLTRLIRAMAEPGREDANFELEVHTALQAEKDSDSKRVLRGGRVVPRSILARTQQVGDFTTGGALVETGDGNQGVIEGLSATPMVSRAGASILDGLVGDVDLPTDTGGEDVYWLGEDDDTTSTAKGFSKILLRPKTVGISIYLSRRFLLQQSQTTEAWLRQELQRKLLIELDRVALHGGGAKEPVGIASTPGIGSVAIGSNGGAITYGACVDLEAAPSLENAAVGNLGFMTNAAVRREGRQILQNASATDATWLFSESKFQEADRLIGYPAYVTNQVSSTLTKGSSASVCSALFFGNWADLVLGIWGHGVDLIVDTSTYSSRGGLKLVALLDVDVAVRHPESFAAILDITTT